MDDELRRLADFSAHHFSAKVSQPAGNMLACGMQVLAER
jgi:hypothetical protein